MDTFLELVELSTGNVAAKLPESGRVGLKQPRTFAFVPDRRQLFLVEYDGAVSRWNPLTGSLERRFVADWRIEQRDRDADPKLWLAGAIFTSDCRRLIAAGKSVLGVWVAETGQLERSWRFETRAPSHLAISHDGKSLAAAYANYAGEISPTTISVWDVASGAERLRLEPDRRAHLLAFSPDGSRLATVAYEGIITIWDVR